MSKMNEGFPRVGSALIVRDEANRILLGKRNKDPQRGNWVLPGGRIHAFESIAEAAARELEEETGLKVEVQSQFRVYEVINSPQEHRVIIYSWARAVGGELRASDDLSDAKFVSLRDLGALPLTPLVERVLRDAGYIANESLAVSASSGDETPLLFPVLIAGAGSRQPPHQHGRTQRKRRSRPAPIVRQSALLFDISVAD
jgi:8-oxo-dGTP diphosphatase